MFGYNFDLVTAFDLLFRACSYKKGSYTTKLF